MGGGDEPDSGANGKPGEGSGPGCPRCSRTLTWLEVVHRRGNWGGFAPRPRPERWWECRHCDWVGYQRRAGGALTAMRRLAGEEGTCFFCGEEEANVVSAPSDDNDGWRRDWLVCLVCGTSNPRRYRY
ncbi:hypothetical protein IHE48_09525 [Frankia sp. CH37]|nr:hypothetical protein [Parafrankia sp. CH37]